MKRRIIIIALFWVAQIVVAQNVIPLISALKTIEQSQSEYTINIESNGLDSLYTAEKTDGLNAVNAVRKVCKGLPVKVKVHGKRIYVQYERRKTVRKLTLKGEVQDIRAHKPLIGATVVLLSADSTVIAQKEARHHWYAEEYDWETSEFSFEVPAMPAKYIFRISHVGFKTTYVDYKLERIGRREHERGLPPFYLAPQSTVLQEVVVTASKVKFYYRGDTLIYNADAFILAEGSMLDALIGQLPGVELKRDGRIYHNGKFVDDLLLNGKQFFSRDRKLMLENLPAYTVKDIAIYNKQTDENEWLGIKDEHSQRYVIDVRLKKEYMIGWIANAEAGAGTGNRYLARLFAMRHTDFSQLGISANANNLDDDSRPGDNDSWQRGSTNNLRRTERADLHFSVSDRNKRWEIYSSAAVNHQHTEGETRTVRQNYLPTGDTYDHSFSSSRNEDLRLSSSLDFIRNGKAVRWTFSPNFNYHRFDHSSDLASATFNAPVADVSRHLLDQLYSPTSSRLNLRDTLVNRILRQGVGNGHAWEGTLNASATIKIPHSNENIRLGASINYTDRDEHLFNRQTVDYAATSLQPPTYNHQYNDNHPHRDGLAQLRVGYNIPLGPGWRSLYTTYYFTHKWQHHRSSLYLLDVPQAPPSAPEGATIDPTFNSKTIEAPSGAVGGALGATLPSVSEYQQVMDSHNSFDSRSTEDRHKLDINLGYAFDEKSYGKIWTLLDGNISLRSQHLDYQRGRIDTALCRTAFTISMADWTCLDLKGGHQIGLTLGVQTNLPDLEQRIDLRDDTDPMNIRLGNTNLRTAVTPEFQINGSYRKKLSYHYLEWGYQRTYNAIAMGYVYDPQTGVRTYRPENVDGNWTTNGGYTFHCALDSAKKLNLDIPFHITYAQSVDLVGVAPLSSPEGDTNVLKSNEAPSGAVGGATSTVHRLALSLSPTFKADIGRHHLELTCQPTWERLTGTRPDFQDFHAFTCRTSLAAILKLPWKLDLSTDLGLYTRTGYADENLNTSDLVWNARLSRPFFKGNFLVVVDGFDLLGQLSNVTRTLNAQGRTETYTNVMPSYALVHIIYRLNKRPKSIVSN